MSEVCGQAIIITNRKTTKRGETEYFVDLPASLTECGRHVRDVFEKLKFKVIYCDEARVGTIKASIDQAIHAQYDSHQRIVFYYLGHGLEGKILTEDGELSIEKDVLQPFCGIDAEDILTIPKLFFFDCCQGRFWDGGKEVPMGEPTNHERLAAIVRRVPPVGNMLLVYSTHPYFKAFCHQEDGPYWSSIFLKELPKDQPLVVALENTNSTLMEKFKLTKNEERKLYGSVPRIQAPFYSSTLYSGVINLWREAYSDKPVVVSHAQSGRMGTDGEDSTDAGLNSEPNLIDLVNEVAAKIPARWKAVGLQLGLQPAQLEGMENFVDVFTQWKKEQKYPYTWLKLLQVLRAEAVGEIRLANEIQTKLTVRSQ